MQSRTFAVGLSLLSLVPGLAYTQETDPPAIVVSGVGVVEAEPDRASVRVGVESRAATAREAQAQTNRVARGILEAMEDLGVSERRVRTSRVSLFPVYERPPDRPRGDPVLVGYRATNTVTVELEDPGRVGPVLDAAIEAGANRVEDVAFDLRDEGEARSEALAAAVLDARAKAQTIADALEVELGSVLETIEQGVSVPRPDLVRFEAMATQEAVQTPVSPGLIRVTASVTIRYRIGPR